MGVVGELHPEVAATYDIAVPCAVFEISTDPLFELRPQPRTYREVSRQPVVRRDVAPTA